jgi:hypothetical protein
MVWISALLIGLAVYLLAVDWLSSKWLLSSCF